MTTQIENYLTALNKNKIKDVIINYDSFMKESNIIHNDTITNSQEGLNYLCTLNEEQHFMISYNEKIQLTNGLLGIDENGHSYIDYLLIRKFDIIDNVRIIDNNKNIKINYIIGGIMYDFNMVNELITTLIHPDDCFIRITFLKPYDDELKCFIYFKAYLLNTFYRKMISSCTVITKSNIYNGGFCHSI